MTTQVGGNVPVNSKGAQAPGQDGAADGEGFAESLASVLTDGSGPTGQDAQDGQGVPLADQDAAAGQVAPLVVANPGVLAATLNPFTPFTPTATTVTTATSAGGVSPGAVGAGVAAGTQPTVGGPGAPTVSPTDAPLGAAGTVPGTTSTAVTASVAPAASVVTGHPVSASAGGAPGASATVHGQGPQTAASSVPAAPAAPAQASSAQAAPALPLPGTTAMASVVAPSPSPQAGPPSAPGATAEVVADTPTVGDSTGMTRQAPVQVAPTGPALSLAATSTPTAQRVQELAVQVSAHVRAVATMPDGSYAMTVQAHPADLGPVTMTVRLHEGTVDVAIAAAHEHARAALTEASPAIRRELAVAGLVCDRVSVSAEHGAGSSYQQAGHDAQPDRGTRQGPHEDRRARTWMDSGEPHEKQPPALVTTKTTPTGVDVRV